ncbi:hypothetical protein J6590_102962, partial [Homalodisca vitripennis]
DGIKCSDCITVCHLKCVGAVTRNKKWKCTVECASNSSKTSESGTASSTILDAIAAFRKENNDRWDSNNIKLDEVQAEVKSVKSDISSLKAEILEVKAQCREAGENIDTLRSENKKLTEELATGRKGDRGPPCSVLYLTRCENVLAIGEEEEGFYDGTRASKFLPQTPIYLNEHLTPQSRAIFNGARALVKQGKLSTVWTSDSKVMAKLTPDHRPSVSGASSISPN